MLYGSGSELSDSEDDTPKPVKSKKRGRKQDTFIREGSENPVDLLDSNAFSYVSAHQPVSAKEELRRRAKAATRASTFKSTQDGRIIIEDSTPSSKKQEPKDREYDAYREMQESTDMAKRGHQDRVKFSNKRSRPDAEDFDVEMTDSHGGETVPKKKRVVFDGRKRGIQKRRPI